MDNIRKQKMIASILLDIGLDDDIIEVITSLSKEDIKQIAIVSFGNKLVSPCGSCRQVMVELLAKDCRVILANQNEYQITTVEELMPLAFKGDSLECSNQDL